MRCEICNRSMTAPFCDGNDSEHWYCEHCEDAILEAMSEYEEDDDWWCFDEDAMAGAEYLEDLVDEGTEDTEESGEVEESFEDNQGVSDTEEGS